MVDRDRVLVKLDELEGYLGELRSIMPPRLPEYLKVEKKRACERLLQIAVEADDALVFETASRHLVGDLDTFKREVLAFLRAR